MAPPSGAVVVQAASRFRPGGLWCGVLERVQLSPTPTNQPPWAVDDPLAAHRARRRVRWDQWAVAALAVYYIVLLYLIDGVGADLTWFTVLAVVPLLIRNRAAFAVTAPVIGLLLLALLCAGWPVAPAGLPLLLAQIRLPERWMPVGVPVLFAGTTAVLSMLARLFSGWS